MDYINQQRVKVWGTARVVENDAALLRQLEDPGYEASVERAIVLTVKAWDVNCPQHIHQRLPASHVAEVVERLQRRIAELESQLRGSTVGAPILTA